MLLPAGHLDDDLAAVFFDQRQPDEQAMAGMLETEAEVVPAKDEPAHCPAHAPAPAALLRARKSADQAQVPTDHTLLNVDISTQLANHSHLQGTAPSLKIDRLTAERILQVKY